MSAVTERPRVSVLDDEEEIASYLERQLDKEGFDVARIEPPSSGLDDTLDLIVSQSDLALCDHDLAGGLRVDFSGAELVAELTRHDFPSVLFTGVLPKETFSIRRYMADIPVLLHRDQGLNRPNLQRALADSVAEVRDGQRRRARRGRRTPVSIKASRRSGTEEVISVLVSGWSGHELIEMPADLLHPAWAERAEAAVGHVFMATVNVGQADPFQLFFEDFEETPLTVDRFGDGRS